MDNNDIPINVFLDLSKAFDTICGDFNIDLLKSDSHNGTKEFLDVLYILIYTH